MLGELHADDLVKALRDMRCYSRKHGIGIILKPFPESDEFAFIEHVMENEVHSTNFDIGIADVDCDHQQLQDNRPGIYPTRRWQRRPGGILVFVHSVFLVTVA